MGDGYYVLLRPLSKGAHTIRLGGTFHYNAGEIGPDPVGILLGTTFHVTVE